MGSRGFTRHRKGSAEALQVPGPVPVLPPLPLSQNMALYHLWLLCWWLLMSQYTTCQQFPGICHRETAYLLLNLFVNAGLAVAGSWGRVCPPEKSLHLCHHGTCDPIPYLCSFTHPGGRCPAVPGVQESSQVCFRQVFSPQVSSGQVPALAQRIHKGVKPAEVVKHATEGQGGCFGPGRSEEELVRPLAVRPSAPGALGWCRPPFAPPSSAFWQG